MARSRKYPQGIWNAERPKMNNRGGKTWDQLDVILPNGNKIKAHFDSTWGNYFYFQDPESGRWYRGGWEWDTGKSPYTPTPDLRITPPKMGDR